jgi:hypothetical protein
MTPAPGLPLPALEARATLGGVITDLAEVRERLPVPAHRAEAVARILDRLAGEAVPDYAKSAATLLALGAHEILMGPTSDLGPVDPQFQLGDFDLVSAKDMIAAVERALDDVAERPDTYPLHASLLADVGAFKVVQARSALARTDDLVREALSSSSERSSDEVNELVQQLLSPSSRLRRSTQLTRRVRCHRSARAVHRGWPHLGGIDGHPP